MTNKHLRQWYRRYNRKYFGGQLPEIYVRFAKMPQDHLGWSNHMGTDWIGIEISKEIKTWSRIVRCVLLHEMVHIRLPYKINHGPRFEKEMLRLAKARAFRGIW